MSQGGVESEMRPHHQHGNRQHNGNGRRGNNNNSRQQSNKNTSHRPTHNTHSQSNSLSQPSKHPSSSTSIPAPSLSRPLVSLSASSPAADYEWKLESLTSMGFDPSFASSALDRASGDVQLAIDYLTNDVEYEYDKKTQHKDRKLAKTNIKSQTDAPGVNHSNPFNALLHTDNPRTAATNHSAPVSAHATSSALSTSLPSKQQPPATSHAPKSSLSASIAASAPPPTSNRAASSSHLPLTSISAPSPSPSPPVTHHNKPSSTPAASASTSTSNSTHPSVRSRPSAAAERNTALAHLEGRANKLEMLVRKVSEVLDNFHVLKIHPLGPHWGREQVDGFFYPLRVARTLYLDGANGHRNGVAFVNFDGSKIREKALRKHGSVYEDRTLNVENVSIEDFARMMLQQGAPSYLFEGILSNHELDKISSENANAAANSNSNNSSPQQPSTARMAAPSSTTVAPFAHTNAHARPVSATAPPRLSSTTVHPSTHPPTPAASVPPPKPLLQLVIESFKSSFHGCRVRGMPFHTQREDLLSFFKDSKVSQVYLCRKENGRRTDGEAFVNFVSEVELKKGIRRDGKKLLDRFVEVLSVTVAQFEREMSEQGTEIPFGALWYALPENHPTRLAGTNAYLRHSHPTTERTIEVDQHLQSRLMQIVQRWESNFHPVRINNLHNSCEPSDIIAFFDPLPLTKRQVFFLSDCPSTRRSGDAFINFNSEEDREEAITRSGNQIRVKNATVTVLPVSHSMFRTVMKAHGAPVEVEEEEEYQQPAALENGGEYEYEGEQEVADSDVKQEKNMQQAGSIVTTATIPISMSVPTPSATSSGSVLSASSSPEATLPMSPQSPSLPLLHLAPAPLIIQNDTAPSTSTSTSASLLDRVPLSLSLSTPNFAPGFNTMSSFGSYDYFSGFQPLFPLIHQQSAPSTLQQHPAIGISALRSANDLSPPPPSSSSPSPPQHTNPSITQPSSVPHANSVSSFLTGIGCGQFVEKFNQEGLTDWHTLSFLQEENLKDLGLALGPRIKLMGFIAQYKQTGIPPSTPNTANNATVSISNPASHPSLHHSLPSLSTTSSPAPASSIPLSSSLTLNNSMPHSSTRLGDPSYDSPIPSDYVCPITNSLLLDPVIAADGKSYERAAISAYLASNRMSPLAQRPLLSNDPLRTLIQHWQVSHAIRKM